MSEAVRQLVLALGSNLGDRVANLQGGLAVLCAGSGLTCTAVSPLYESAAVGGPPQPDYLNAVTLADSALHARAILDRCQAAERACGRVRTVRWGPRTLDVDLIACGLETAAGPELTLPHPRAHERAFVLVPWHDVDPGAVIPGRGTVTQLLAGLGDGGLRRRPDLHLRLPG